MDLEPLPSHEILHTKLSLKSADKYTQSLLTQMITLQRQLSRMKRTQVSFQNSERIKTRNIVSSDLEKIAKSCRYDTTITT